MSHEPIEGMSASEAIAKLKEGNERYLAALVNPGDISPDTRTHICENGQQPYAIIVACSDSRVIPEAAFCAGLGDLFVIRVAGNVIDDHQLGSIEYAASHLGCKLVLVLGHTHCGAVGAAINDDPSGYIKFITDEIKSAIGDETDDYRASCLNVAHSIAVIETSLEIQKEEREDSLVVAGALYRLEDGKVIFLP